MAFPLLSLPSYFQDHDQKYLSSRVIQAWNIETIKSHQNSSPFRPLYPVPWVFSLIRTACLLIAPLLVVSKSMSISLALPPFLPSHTLWFISLNNLSPVLSTTLSHQTLTLFYPNCWFFSAFCFQVLLKSHLLVQLSIHVSKFSKFSTWLSTNMHPATILTPSSSHFFQNLLPKPGISSG